MNRRWTPDRGRGWGLVSLVLIAALVLVASAQTAAAPARQAGVPFDTIPLPPEALSWTPDLIGGTRTSRNPRLDSAMNELASAQDSQAALTAAQSQSLRLSGGRVQVQVATHPHGIQGAVRAVTEAGGEVTVIRKDAMLFQGWLPMAALEDVAADDDVYLIRRPTEFVLVEDVQSGNSTTEGFDVINGPAWHAAGHTGAGVKVGIIDAGFEGYSALLGTDLPAAVTVKNFVDGETDGQVDGTTKRGTACAEIIHDIAPEASLYLAKVATDLDLQEAVTWLIDEEVDVISTSLSLYNATPGDGTGYLADLVQDAREAGILWVTAAGDDREAHWGGAYYDPEDKGTHHYSDNRNVNYFGSGDGTPYAIPEGNLVGVFLRWDDWVNVDQDYDLVLLRWNGSSWDPIAAGQDDQDGSPGQTPTEFAAAVTSGDPTPYGFVILRIDSDRDVNLEVFAPGLARLDEILHARSLVNLADAPGAMTVAALDVNSPYPQEPYSAEGPTNGPGGAETGGFTKPDIAAFANVSTESYGSTNKFCGTGAATPHVAGAAALVLGAYPGHTPNEVQSFLEGHAVDMGPAGMDTISGHGRLYLNDPPSAEPEDYMIYLPLILSDFPPPPPESPVLDAIDNTDGDGSYTVSWSSAEYATTYTLQEDDNGDFSSPTTVYEGADTTKTITGKDMGTYYYRVKARNVFAESAWSNVESVTVTEQLPDEPEPGNWAGKTSQNRSISWTVSSDSTEIETLTLSVYWGGACGVSSTLNYFYGVPIKSDGTFKTSSSVGTVEGEFTSTTTAQGDFDAVLELHYPYYCRATRSGTWTAEHQP
ncbi:MAG: S8 family serine peptidase [Anaerolineae bacterium]